MSARPLLLGHRGARSVRSVSENTLASFDAALAHGCDGVELDVRTTGCGRLVVCHNPKVGKIVVGRATAGQLLQLTRLEEVLERYSHQTFLDIELKVPGIESRVLGLLREYARRNNLVVSSFLPAVVMEIKARSALVPTGIICERPSQLVRWRKLPADYVIVRHPLLTRKLVESAQASKRKILAWTVNDAGVMRRLAGWGVDGIISDRTELLAQTFC